MISQCVISACRLTYSSILVVQNVSCARAWILAVCLFVVRRADARTLQVLLQLYADTLHILAADRMERTMRYEKKNKNHERHDYCSRVACDAAVWLLCM